MMICVCDYDEYNWPSMDPGCPVHNRPKTWTERVVTWFECLW